jgi:hypothetical protein
VHACGDTVSEPGMSDATGRADREGERRVGEVVFQRGTQLKGKHFLSKEADALQVGHSHRGEEAVGRDRLGVSWDARRTSASRIRMSGSGRNPSGRGLSSLLTPPDTEEHSRYVRAGSKILSFGPPSRRLGR